MLREFVKHNERAEFMNHMPSNIRYRDRNVIYRIVKKMSTMFFNKNKEMVDEYLCLKTQISEFTSAFS